MSIDLQTPAAVERVELPDDAEQYLIAIRHPKHVTYVVGWEFSDAQVGLESLKKLTADARLAAALRAAPAAEQVGVPESVRPEVAAFALLMERELRTNDHKHGWKGDHPVFLADRVWQETEELRDLFRPDPDRNWSARRDQIASEAADVANMAMMVADVCGCLDGIQDTQPRLTLNEWAAKSHSDQIKWWQNPMTGEDIERNDGELLMLMVSEIAEAMEGVRKNLMDDKLPHRRMVEVELADLFIRMMDFAGARGLDLDGAVAEKIAFNAVRKDHTFEARLAANGKKF